MPHEPSGHTPTGNPDANPLPPPPPQTTIKQRIVALEAKGHTHEKLPQRDDPVSVVKRGEWWLIRLGFLSLIATLVVAYIYYRQLEVMRRQMFKAEDIDTRNTETQVLSNMPLILPSNLLVTVYSNARGKSVVRFHQDWINLGESRAEGPDIVWEVGLSPTDKRTLCKRHVGEWAKTTWIKGAPANDEIEIKKSLLGHAGRRGAPIYVYGTIRYSDVFPNKETRHDHLVEYCTMVTRLFDPHDAGYVHPCEQGNCYDKHCGADYAEMGK